MSIADLIARDLCIEPQTIMDLARNTGRHYHSFRCGDRQIDAPDATLKLVQMWIHDFVLRHDEKLPDFVTAYERGSSIKRNAELHRKKSHHLHVDIRHFFHSCKHEMVRRYLLSLDLPDISGENLEEDICLLTHLTVKNGSLPMGSPCSPVLANRIMLPTDHKIQATLEPGSIYSRYSDDICISSDRWIDYDGTTAAISKILAADGFSINWGKTYCVGRGDARKVTGVYVTPEGELTLGKNRKRLLRKSIYDYLTKGAGNPRAIRGLVCFCEMIDPVYVSRVIASYVKYDTSGENRLYDLLSGKLPQTEPSSDSTCDLAETTS